MQGAGTGVLLAGAAAPQLVLPALALALGPLLGGVLAQENWWHLYFWAGVPLAAAAAAWFAYTKIQDQLSANKPVVVPNAEGIKEVLAVQKVRNAGLVRGRCQDREDEHLWRPADHRSITLLTIDRRSTDL